MAGNTEVLIGSWHGRFVTWPMPWQPTQPNKSSTATTSGPSVIEGNTAPAAANFVGGDRSAERAQAVSAETTRSAR